MNDNYDRCQKCSLTFREWMLSGDGLCPHCRQKVAPETHLPPLFEAYEKELQAP